MYTTKSLLFQSQCFWRNCKFCTRKLQCKEFITRPFPKQNQKSLRTDELFWKDHRHAILFTPVFQPHNNMGLILWESHYNTLILPLCSCVMAKKYKSILQAWMLNTVPLWFSYQRTWLNKFQVVFMNMRKLQMSFIVPSQSGDPNIENPEWLREVL